MTDSVRVGLVGYGYASATFHAPLLNSVPGMELVAVSSQSPERVRDALPGVEVLAEPSVLFARRDIDLVVIPTPNDTHYGLAVQALNAGKHVVIDKPFTLDVVEARDLLDRAEAAGRVLSVFHNRRWDGDFLGIRQLLEQGTLGQLSHVESHFDRYRPAVRQRWREAAGPGSGLWYDLGPHLLDQTLVLFGMPDSIMLDVACQRAGAQTVDWFHAVLSYDTLRVILHGSALVAAAGPRFVLHGSEGSYVKYGLDSQETQLKAGLTPGGAGWGVDPSPGVLTRARGDELVAESCVPVSGDYRAYYGGIRDAILHGAPTPVSGFEALQVMRLIEAGLLSAEEGRVVHLAGLA